MVAYYNADIRRTYRDVSRRFGVGKGRVQELLFGLVEKRVGKVRRDGTRRVVENALPKLSQFLSEREQLVRRTIARKARLEQDPDILRCRAEQEKRAAAQQALLARARAEFEGRWDGLADIINPRRRRRKKG